MVLAAAKVKVTGGCGDFSRKHRHAYTTAPIHQHTHLHDLPGLGAFSCCVPRSLGAFLSFFCHSWGVPSPFWAASYRSAAYAARHIYYLPGACLFLVPAYFPHPVPHTPFSLGLHTVAYTIWYLQYVNELHDRVYFKIWSTFVARMKSSYK